MQERLREFFVMTCRVDFDERITNATQVAVGVAGRVLLCLGRRNCA